MTVLCIVNTVATMQGDATVTQSNPFGTPIIALQSGLLYYDFLVYHARADLADNNNCSVTL